MPSIEGVPDPQLVPPAEPNRRKVGPSAHGALFPVCRPPEELGLGILGKHGETGLPGLASFGLPTKKKPGTSAPTKEAPQRQRDLWNALGLRHATAKADSGHQPVRFSHEHRNRDSQVIPPWLATNPPRLHRGVPLTATDTVRLRPSLSHVVAGPYGPVLVGPREKRACQNKRPDLGSKHPCHQSGYRDAGRQDSLSAVATPEGPCVWCTHQLSLDCCLLSEGGSKASASKFLDSHGPCDDRSHTPKLQDHRDCFTADSMEWVSWPHNFSGSCIVNIAVFHLRCRSGMLIGFSLEPCGSSSESKPKAS